MIDRGNLHMGAPIFAAEGYHVLNKIEIGAPAAGICPLIARRTASLGRGRNREESSTKIPAGDSVTDLHENAKSLVTVDRPENAAWRRRYPSQTAGFQYMIPK
jgi:hypothetical protein